MKKLIMLLVRPLMVINKGMSVFVRWFSKIMLVVVFLSILGVIIKLLSLYNYYSIDALESGFILGLVISLSLIEVTLIFVVLKLKFWK